MAGTAFTMIHGTRSSSTGMPCAATLDCPVVTDEIVNMVGKSEQWHES